MLETGTHCTRANNTCSCSKYSENSVSRQTDIPIVGPPSLDDMVVPSSAAREREQLVHNGLV